MGNHFKVIDLLISVVDWCGNVTVQPAGGGGGGGGGGGICAVSPDPLGNCGRVAGVTMCGVGCTACTAPCTYQCTAACTYQCTVACTYQCTGACTFACTYQCTGYCTAHCTYQCTGACTGYCTNQCTGACTYQCTGYCTNTCTNPSICGPTPNNIGGAAQTFADVDLDRADPVALVQLRDQLREALANVEAAGRRQDERLMPATIEDVDMLERKLRAALEALRERRAELERRGDA